MKALILFLLELQKHKLPDFELIQMKNKSVVLSKFYNMEVDDFRGETSFHIYQIDDLNPIYDYRLTSKGQRIVNTKLFDLKKKLREKHCRKACSRDVGNKFLSLEFFWDSSLALDAEFA